MVFPARMTRVQPWKFKPHELPIETPRLELRPLQRADAEALAALVTPLLFRLDRDMTGFDAVPWIESKLTSEALLLCRVIVAEQTVVGYIQVAVKTGPRHNFLSLGGWLGRAHWGKAYADESLEAVQRHLSRPGWPALYSRADRRNAPSIRALQRAGFKRCADPSIEREPDYVWFRYAAGG